jgi:hypothetical protein
MTEQLKPQNNFSLFTCTGTVLIRHAHGNFRLMVPLQNLLFYANSIFKWPGLTNSVTVKYVVTLINLSFQTWSCKCACYEVLWRSGGIAAHILNVGSRWRWVVGFMLWQLFTLRERTQSTHLIWGWVVTRAGQDILEKRKMPCLCQDWTKISWSLNL